jgi:hypothetical protein
MFAALICRALDALRNCSCRRARPGDVFPLPPEINPNRQASHFAFRERQPE